MTKALIPVILLCAALSFSQFSSQTQATGADRQTAKNTEDEITVRGCVSRSHKHFVLIQSDVGNTYQLEGNKKLQLGSYLGQEVEVSGPESPSLRTSSDFGAGGSASPVTITVHSIKSIHPRCSAN